MNVDALVKLYYVALVISTVAVVVLVVMVRRQGRSAGGNSRGIFIGSIVAAVLAIGFFIAVSGVGFFSPPKSCVYCHEMNPEYNAWRRSAHAHVTCLACHLKANEPAGYIVEELSVLREVWNHFTGSYPKIINSDSRLSQREMTSAVCERCHNQAKLGVVKFGENVKVEHQPHLKLGINCQHCHNRVTHKGASGYNYLDGLRMMDGCMRCHMPGAGKRVKGVTAPTGCSVCHQKGWTQTVFGKSKVKKADFDDCRACHKLRDPSVVSSFAASKMAAAVDCSDCHSDHFGKFDADPDPAQCDKCHTGVAAKVVKGTHGAKAKDRLKPMPANAAQVRCSVCHAPHKFPVPGAKP